ncbi:signal peptidase I [Nocardioides campestrisoli]|uniref:signal peptidase I n=1 Tax=Nocardioides campestrisoli TaxID=2736757 RepID=UPI001CD1A73D|nr:signal peptidase I [Nocardioides campestrisoli]
MKRVVQALRRPVRALNTLLLLAVMAGCAAYIAPSLFGYERYIITGGSMSGTIEKGSIVFEKQVPVDDLAVGDVITYVPPADSGVSTLVTHRITSIKPGEDGVPVLRTQGDANADVDPWKFSLQADTQPVVSYDVPLLGYAFIFLADPANRMFVIGIPAAGIALMALRDLLLALVRRDESSSQVPDPSRVPDPSPVPDQARELVRDLVPA